MDIYAAVTERIIAQMEQGVIPWCKPWVSSGRAVSHATGKPYSLLNQMLLGRPGEYLTYLLQVANFEKNFGKYCQRARITKRVSPHTLRNNFAKRCLLAGMDIYTLSRILGHNSVEITEQAYLDVKEHDLKKQYVRFSPVESILSKNGK